MGYVQILSDQTGSGNMTASKPEILISQLSNEIETKLQWLKLRFRGPVFELH